MTQWLLRRIIKDYDNTKDLEVRSALGSLAGWVGIIANVLMVAGKVTVGFISGSVSVVADGLNNLLDAAGSIISLIGFKISAKEADKEHPFGHGRYEYISALAVAVMVFLVGIELGKSSIERIINPTAVEFGTLSFAVLLASVLLKLWLYKFNRDVGLHIDSTSLKATSIDSLGDVIATSVVLLAAIISRFTGVNLDGWAGLGVAAFIIYNGINLVKETMSPLIGEAPDPELVKQLTEMITANDCVKGTHDLIVHDYGPGRQFASAHVEISSEVDTLTAHSVIDAIERDVLETYNINLIIHHDPVKISNPSNKPCK
jgi:cation diffusion facilitator family transporter